MVPLVAAFFGTGGIYKIFHTDTNGQEHKKEGEAKWPVHSAWLLCGHFTERNGAYAQIDADGPWCAISKSTIGGGSVIPHVGDLIALGKPRRLFVVGWKSLRDVRDEDIMKKSPVDSFDDSRDYIGVTLDKGTIVPVRDAVLGFDPTLPERRYALWIRVGQPTTIAVSGVGK